MSAGFFDECYQVLASSGSLLILLYSDTNYALEVPLKNYCSHDHHYHRDHMIIIIAMTIICRTTQLTRVLIIAITIIIMIIMHGNH